MSPVKKFNADSFGLSASGIEFDLRNVTVHT
jgi:hypothetical protein